MSVWVVEIPRKGQSLGEIIVCDSEAQAARLWNDAKVRGHKDAVCWDMVSGCRK